MNSTATLKSVLVPAFEHKSGNVLGVDGADIYYEDHGATDAPALLFLHGGFGTIEDFNVILPRLKGKFRVIGIDSRGHGRSTLGSAELSYERLQKDTEAVLDHLQLNEVSIIGFSDGGIVAYRLAALTKLTLPKLITIGAPAELEDDARQLYSKITPESWRKKFPETYATYEKLNPEPDFDTFAKAAIEMWKDSGPTGYPGDHVDNIKCPLLIVRGDEDHLVSRAGQTALADRVKESRFSNIAFAGHVAFEDQPAVFLTALNRFLAE